MRKVFLVCGRYPSYIFLALAVLLHRFLLLAYLQVDYDNLISQNEGYVTWQYLPLSILKDNLLTGLLYLQQNPPLAQIIVGIVLKLVGSMRALSYVLVGLQAIISTITTLFLYRLLTVTGVLRALALAIASIFAFSADLVFLEYRSFGQLIYETLCMPFLLGVVFLLYRYQVDKNRRNLFFVGLLVALMALTRASLGYFVLVVISYLFFIRANTRSFLVFLLPVLLLQGGWSVKNLWVYGYLSLPATSWTGLNMMKVLDGTNKIEAVKKQVSEEFNLYPAWFVRLVQDVGYQAWFAGWYKPYIPQDVQKFDALIADRLPGNPVRNTMGMYEVSNCYKRVVLRYALTHPGDYLSSVFSSYIIFWQPIRDYTKRFSTLLYVEKSSQDIWREAGLEGVVQGELKNNCVLLGTKIPDRFQTILDVRNICKPAGVVVLPYAGLIMYAVNVFAIHVLGPVLIVMLFFSRQVYGFDRRFLFFLYLVYLYFSVVSSFGDQGENNRFRLMVEPVIWLLTVNILVGFSHLFLNRSAIKKNGELASYEKCRDKVA